MKEIKIVDRNGSLRGFAILILLKASTIVCNVTRLRHYLQWTFKYDFYMNAKTQNWFCTHKRVKRSLQRKPAISWTKQDINTESLSSCCQHKDHCNSFPAPQIKNYKFFGFRLISLLLHYIFRLSFARLQRNWTIHFLVNLVSITALINRPKWDLFKIARHSLRIS